MNVILGILGIFGTIFTKLFGNSVAEPAKNIKSLVNNIVLTQAEKARYQHILDKINAETCKIEASHPNNLISGARAAIIWICAIVLAIYWVPQYGVATYFWIKGCIIHGGLINYPLSAEKLFEMIASLLGLGTLGFLHKIFK
jgi:hypothetical protein